MCQVASQLQFEMQSICRVLRYRGVSREGSSGTEVLAGKAAQVQRC